jgi:hypothetical protein
MRVKPVKAPEFLERRYSGDQPDQGEFPAFSFLPIGAKFSAHQALILPDIRIRTDIGEVSSKAFDAAV